MTAKVIIIGAGPAGLTAALEIARQSTIKPVVLEALEDVGGISRTIEYKGNRMDLGGHRFFSKNEWVMRWWQDLMPIAPEMDTAGLSKMPAANRHMLVRPRFSRIYFLRKFFDYPISITIKTMAGLGTKRIIRIGVSYLIARLFPRSPERHLEDFFYNRFGGELYRIFFKDYTEKVWGIACNKISPSWGAQRIKGLSITKAAAHAIKKIFAKGGNEYNSINTETSLIERFLYPKFGPGQMWQIAADEVCAHGGEVHLGMRVTQFRMAGAHIQAVETVASDGTRRWWEADWVISSMPIQDLVKAINPSPPRDVLDEAEGLMYRDFITIGLLVKKLRPRPEGNPPLNLLPDTWIYIQEPDVRIGRLQIFNNWSHALVHDEAKIWLGLEYFCQEGDELWRMNDDALFRFAADELVRIDLINADDVEDWHVVRVPKAYPAYFGSYDRFSVIRQWSDSVENLLLIGRNGMHRYNNQDHSMITAKLAADFVCKGKGNKSLIWEVNTEDKYHEEGNK